MKSGYNVYWTNNALKELAETIHYLKVHFSDKEIKKLAIKIESTISLIAQNPNIFQKSEYKNVYRAILLRNNTLYYRVNNHSIEILSFF